MKKSIILLLFICSAAIAQDSLSWNALVVKKGKKPLVKEDMYLADENGFYLYRNCIYDIELKSGKVISGRLVNVKPDSLCFASSFPGVAKYKNTSASDTLAVHIKELSRLKLISDRALGLFEYYNFDRYNVIIEKSKPERHLPSYWVKLYKNDTVFYEVAPYLTAQGIDQLFERDGQTFYFQGTDMTKEVWVQTDSSYTVRNFFWYTPNEVEEVNGLALGFWADNIKNDYHARDSLKINGVNIECNPLFIMVIMAAPFKGQCPDSIDFYNKELKNKYDLRVNGFNLSIAGTMGQAKLNGVNIAGWSTLVSHMNGLTVSGINNFSYVMNGVSIAGVKNRATRARGVQIALFNRAADLRGVQFGLWNRNAKRSLPLVNWQFKAKKEKMV